MQEGGGGIPLIHFLSRGIFLGTTLDVKLVRVVDLYRKKVLLYKKRAKKVLRCNVQLLVTFYSYKKLFSFILSRIKTIGMNGF